MLITRQSPYTGITASIEIPVTQSQFDMWRQGTPIQTAMPDVSPDDREFIVTGLTASDWEDMMKDEEPEQTQS
jgi:hypothetical protein